MAERRRRNAHDQAYIAWGLNQLRQALQRFNTMAEHSGV